MAVLEFRKPTPRWAYVLVACFSVAASLTAWWGISSSGIVPTAYFPGPLAVAGAGVVMFRDQSFATDVLASAARIAVAFMIAAALAVPLGLLMSSFKIVEGLFEPIVDFIRYVPVPSLLPIFVLLAGIGEQSKFLVLFFGTFFQLVLLTKDDADNVPAPYFDAARTMGARTAALMRDVQIPYLMPLIYDRLRVTLGWCWTYLVIAELIAVDHGMGHVIKEAQRFQDADRLFVCFITLGLIGLGTDYFAKLLFPLLFPYVPRVSLKNG